MRLPLLLAVAVTLALVGTGCKRKAAKPTAADSAPPPSGEPEPPPAPAGSQAPGSTPSPVSNPVSSFSSSPTAPNQQGNLTVTGGQGAIQSPRMAAARTVNRVQLDQLHKSMMVTWTIDNRVPELTEVMKDVQQNPQLAPLVKEGVVVLTGTNRGDGVWAYTAYPQQAGNHFAVTQQGVVPLSPDELRKRLEQQQTAAKLGK